jgi:hypothetical protein
VLPASACVDAARSRDRRYERFQDEDDVMAQFTSPNPPASVEGDGGSVRLDMWRQEKTSVIFPVHGYKEAWDTGMLLLILYSAVVIPFRVCFSSEATGAFWAFELLLSIFFIIDLILNFNTAYQEEDRWIVSRPRIAMNYFRGWFWIDAPSCVPVELIDLYFEESAKGSNLRMLRFLRMFRLLRLLRMLKV